MQVAEKGPAMVNLLRAIEINPKNADYHNSLGIAYTEIGATAEAKRHF